jgi:hypothetical protein
MIKRHTVQTLLVFLFCSLLNANGQSMRSSLEYMAVNNYSEEFLKSYLKPFAIAMGTNMSSALSFTADAKQLPHFGISAILMSTSVPKDDRTFTDGMTGIVHPTVFGSSRIQGSSIEGIGESRLSYPLLQLNLGLFAYLELFFRYTNWDIDKIGNVELRGFGVKYELIEIPYGTGDPFFISLMADYQNLQLDDYMESAAFGMTFNISKRLSLIPVTLLGGIQYANNILTVEAEELAIGSELGTINIDGLK